MKTFNDFLSSKEYIIENDDSTEGLERALKIAADDHHEDVMSFLKRLASQNPDIQIELDKMNHKLGNMPARHKKKPDFGDAESRGDVVVPNNADGPPGDLP